MRLIAENLGRIARAQIELRPLTVFIGENGTNKTWVAHGLFKILEALRSHARQPTRSIELDASVAHALDERSASIVQRAEETPGEARLEVTRAELTSTLSEEVTFGLAGPQWRSALGFTPSADARLTLALTREEFAAGVASSLRIGLSTDPYQLTTELFSEGQGEPVAATSYGVIGEATLAHRGSERRSRSCCSAGGAACAYSR